MKYAAMITSAINTKFGVYDSDQRLAQTLETVRTVREKIPGVKIFLIEMAGRPLTTEQKEILTAAVDHIIDFTADPNVVGLFDSTDNWDVVKNVTEVMCFRMALSTISESQSGYDIDRFFKVSGRYLLNDQFDIGYYDSYRIKPFIVVGDRRSSQFPVELTGVEKQFMTRLWSWPAALNTEIISVYKQCLKYMYSRLANNGYADIEHCLYKFLDHDKVIEKSPLGVEGNISPNGVPVRD